MCIQARVVILFLFSFLFSSSIHAADTLVVGYNSVPPFVVESETGLNGPSVWLWENIAEENQLVYRYKKLPLDSLLKGLQHNQVDLCISPLTVTAERADYIDFTSPYHIAYASILQREESAFMHAINFIRSFFSLNFLRALGALAFVILIFGILMWFFEKRENPEEFQEGSKGLWDGFWWSAVTMTTVGYGDKSPRSVGGRIVALIWMFTAIIIISGFTASITSSLTLTEIGSSNSNIEDFKSKLLGTIENSATSEWLKNNFFSKKKSFSNMDELLGAVDKEEIDAVAYDRPLLLSVASNDTLEKYKLIEIKYNPQFYAFGMRNGLSDSLQERINISMLKNIEKRDWRVVLSESELD